MKKRFGMDGCGVIVTWSKEGGERCNWMEGAWMESLSKGVWDGWMRCNCDREQDGWRRWSWIEGARLAKVQAEFKREFEREFERKHFGGGSHGGRRSRGGEAKGTLQNAQQSTAQLRQQLPRGGQRQSSTRAPDQAGQAVTSSTAHFKQVADRLVSIAAVTKGGGTVCRSQHADHPRSDSSTATQSGEQQRRQWGRHTVRQHL
jgi:hypothetical protein